MRKLFGEMARRPIGIGSEDDDEPEAPKLTAEELSLVTDVELEEFSDKLILNNKYILKTHKGSAIERSGDESVCDFLVRALSHYAAEQKANSERLMQSVSGSLYSNATLKALQHNHGLSDQLRDTIEKYTRPTPIAGTEIVLRRMPDFQAPKNPIHDTNEILERVVRQVEDFRPLASQSAEIIRSMNDTALRMQDDYLKNAKSAGTQTKIAIGIAVLSLIVSSIFSYQTYADSKDAGEKSEAQIKEFQKEIRELAAAQREERAAIVKAIIEAPYRHAKVTKPKPVTTSKSSSASPKESNSR